MAASAVMQDVIIFPWDNNNEKKEKMKKLLLHSPYTS